MKQRSAKKSTKEPSKQRASEQVEEASEEPTKGSKTTRSATTRKLVLAAAARVFADEGFQAATKERIGEIAGVSHQTVRDYFRTKALLLDAIVSEFWFEARRALGGVEGGGAGAVLAARDKLAALAQERPSAACCAFHTVLHAGNRGGALIVEEEKKFREALETVVSTATGVSGAAVRGRTELLLVLLRSSVASTEDGVREAFIVGADALLAKG
jgi:AcrR family transcriptional regulator